MRVHTRAYVCHLHVFGCMFKNARVCDGYPGAFDTAMADPAFKKQMTASKAKDFRASLDKILQA